jgi:hypothetical protein
LFSTPVSNFDFQYSSSSPIPTSTSGLSFGVLFDSIFAIPTVSGMHEIYSVVSNPFAECVFLQIGSFVMASSSQMCSVPSGFAAPQVASNVRLIIHHS